MTTVCVSLGSAFTRIAIATGSHASKPKIVADHDGRHDLPTCVSLLMPAVQEDGESAGSVAEPEALVAVRLTSTGPSTVICDSFVSDWMTGTEKDSNSSSDALESSPASVPSAERLLGMYLRKCQEIWQSYGQAIPSTLVIVLPCPDSKGCNEQNAVAVADDALQSRMRQLISAELGIQHGVNSMVHVMDAATACCAMALPMLKQQQQQEDKESAFVLVQADWNGCRVSRWMAIKDAEGNPCVHGCADPSTVFLSSVSLAALSAGMTALVRMQAEKKFGCALGGRALGKIGNAVASVLPSLLAVSSGSGSATATAVPGSPISSAANSVSIAVESLYDGMDYSCAIGRARLEDMLDWDSLVKAILSLSIVNETSSSCSSSSCSSCSSLPVFLAGDFANFLARRLGDLMQKAMGASAPLSVLGMSSGLNCGAQEVSAIGGALVATSGSSGCQEQCHYGVLCSKTILVQWQGQQEMTATAAAGDVVVVVARNEPLPVVRLIKPASHEHTEWKLFEALDATTAGTLLAQGKLDEHKAIELTLSITGQLSIREVDSSL